MAGRNRREKLTITTLVGAHLADILTTAFVIDVLHGVEVNAFPAALMAENRTEVFWLIKMVAVGAIALLYAYTKEKDPEKFKAYRKAVELIAVLSTSTVIWNGAQILGGLT